MSNTYGVGQVKSEPRTQRSGVSRVSGLAFRLLRCAACAARTCFLFVVFVLFVVPSFAAEKVTFEEHVKPVLTKNCLVCHAGEQARGGLDLSTFELLMAGSLSGKVVVAGKPSESPLYLLSAHLETPKMPPNKPKILQKDLDTLKRWIEGGLAAKVDRVAEKPAPAALEVNTVASGVMPKNLPAVQATSAARAAAVTALAASPAAPLVAVAGPKQVQLFHAESLKPLGALAFPEGDVFVLKFSRDGRLLMAGGGEGGRSGRVVAWEVETGQRAFAVGEERDVALAADVTADHKHVALGGPGKVVKVFTAADGKLLHTFTKHTDWVTTLEFSPEGLLLASGDRNAGLFVWETVSGKEFLNLRGHVSAVTSVSWRSDSNAFASTGEDGLVRLWDMHKGEGLKAWEAHPGGTLAVAYGPGQRLATCGRDRVVRLWDEEGKPLRELDAFRDHALKVALTHDGSRVVASDFSGEARVWTLADGKLTGTLSGPPPATAAKPPMPPSPNVSVAELEAKQDALAKAAAAEREAAKKAATEADTIKKALADANAVVAGLTPLAAAKARAAKEAEERAARARAAAEKAAADLAAARAMGQSPLREQLEKAGVALELARKEAAEKQAVLKAVTDAAERVKAVAMKSPGNKPLARAAAQAEDVVRAIADEVKAADQAVAEQARTVQKARDALEAAQKSAGPGKASAP